MKSIQSNLIDILNRKIFPAEVKIDNGKIINIIPLESNVVLDTYILPGFVDAHIHVESTMMTPAFFAHEAVKHGTVATVSDPHEIANVCGVEGVQFMIDNAREVPLKIAFGAPSCVPATQFETSGFKLDAHDVADLLAQNDIYYLAEVMNFPGVINNDPSLLALIDAAKKNNKPIDGHAPQLMMPLSQAYFSKGISTDHECVTAEEALDKIALGCQILIREGSAAKNFEALAPLIPKNAAQMMFCSDDKHPDELILGHINVLVQRALKKGYDVFDVLKMACINPVIHYKLPVGLLREGDSADFILIDNLDAMTILQTWIDGQMVYDGQKVLFEPIKVQPINNFHIHKTYTLADMGVAAPIAEGKVKTQVIKAIDGQLITEQMSAELLVTNHQVQIDIEKDILKMCVVNRYHAAPIAWSFIHQFGLKKGALASSVAHDSHNIVAVGADEASLMLAINTLIASQGGIVFACDGEVELIELEVAGLMSQQPAAVLADRYTAINEKVRTNGCNLSSPFMTLSFMALPVIPSLKLTDKGLFDVNEFKMTELFISEPSKP